MLIVNVPIMRIVGHKLVYPATMLSSLHVLWGNSMVSFVSMENKEIVAKSVVTALKPYCRRLSIDP